MTKAQKLVDQAKFRFMVDMARRGIIDAVRDARTHEDKWSLALNATNDEYILAALVVNAAS